MFYAYVALKKEGNTGQQVKLVKKKKRKIILVKCFIAADIDKRDIFMKAMLKKGIW